MTRTNRNKVIFLISFWVISAIFLVIYEWSVLSFEGVTFDLHKVLAVSILVTIISGSFIAFLEVSFFARLLRKKSFLNSLLIKSGFYLINIVLFNSIVILGVASIKGSDLQLNQDVWSHFTNYFFSMRMLTGVIFWGGAVFLALFIVEVGEKFGQGVLVNFLLGRYHRPREERRLFLIMDLNSSTTYAEKLGHIRYSELIQDCFYDLTKVINESQAQIYQYVGDEVVLTWKQYKDMNYKDCLNIFFDFQKLLRTKSAYYTRKYGMIPKFKAGTELGLVTVAEVGVIKKELAYHGDPINTASRLCQMCNEFDTRLLVSENVMIHLQNEVDTNNIEPIGKVKLKGKLKALTVYPVYAYLQN
jgi:adenylate cyclase